MRKMISFLSMAVLVSGASGAWANGGSSGGNGGDAVVCRTGEGEIRSAELLDYYEARVLRGFAQDLGPASLSTLEKVDYVLDRLEPYSPERAKRYRTQAHAFFANAKFVRGIDLVDIPDSEHMILPRGCAVEQIAIQRQPEFPQDKLYLVNEDLWDRFSKDHQAGLILHEVIYTEAMEYEHPDSRRVRYFNSVIASRGFGKTPMLEFARILEATWMNRIEIFGVVGKFLFEPTYERIGGLGSRRTLTGWSKNELVFKPLVGGRTSLEFFRFRDPNSRVSRVRVANGFVTASRGSTLAAEFTADGNVDTLHGARAEFADSDGSILWRASGTLEIRGSLGPVLGAISGMREADELVHARTGRRLGFSRRTDVQSGNESVKTLTFDRDTFTARLRGTKSSPLDFLFPFPVRLAADGSELAWHPDAILPEVKNARVYGGGNFDGHSVYHDGVCSLLGEPGVSELRIRAREKDLEVESFVTSGPSEVICRIPKTVWFGQRPKELRNCGAQGYRMWHYPYLLNGRAGEVQFETESIGCGDRTHFEVRATASYRLGISAGYRYQTGQPSEFTLEKALEFFDPTEVLRVPRRVNREWLDILHPREEARRSVAYVVSKSRKTVYPEGTLIRTDRKLGLVPIGR